MLFLEYYKDTGIIVKGDTEQYESKLKELGGKFSEKRNLWIFNIDKKNEVLKFVDTSLFDLFCRFLKENQTAEAQKTYKMLLPKTKEFIDITSKFIKDKKINIPEKNLSNIIQSIISPDKKEEYDIPIPKTSNSSPKSSPKSSPRTSKTSSEETKTSKSPKSSPRTPKTSKSPKSPKSPTSSPRTSKSKKEYDNPYQKYDEVPEEDALYIFYKTLLEEKPESKISIVWLVEHGIETDSDIINKYKKIKNRK